MKNKKNVKNKVIPNLIWNLQRLSLLNSMRGRSRIKYGMAPNLMGFTLIELLVVVLIIGILAAVAVPQYQKAVEKSRATQLYTLLSAVGKAQQTYRLATGNYTGDFSKLDINFPYESGSETNRFFTGGGYTWKKCEGNSCLYGMKEYQDGIYALQIYFDTGNIVCIAIKNTKATDFCKSLGFTEIWLDNHKWVGDKNATYYK